MKKLIHLIVICVLGVMVTSARLAAAQDTGTTPPVGTGAPAKSDTPPDAAGAAAPGLPAWIEEINNRPWDTGGTFWMPTRASVQADDSDFMFYAVLALSTFFLVGVTAFVVFFTIKYRHRPGHKAQPSAHHNDALEITWSVIPTIICVFLFVGGWDGYVQMQTRPAEPLVIKVTAKKWVWDFEYPNGWHSPNLHVPIDQPVEMQMTSLDVLHAFYVPAFRVKQDIIPRRYTYIYFTPSRLGTYRLYCAEYCGMNHSLMKQKAFVHEASTWQRFLDESKAAEQNMDPVDLGKMVWEKKGCNACHTVDGSPKVGPSWKGTFGTDVGLADGSTVKMDATYIRTAIMEPQKQSRPGYPPSMPTYAGQLSEAEINGVAAYIESLK